LHHNWRLSATLTASLCANVRNGAILTVVNVETTAAEFVCAEDVLNRLDRLVDWDGHWFLDYLDWLLNLYRYWDWNIYDWDVLGTTEAACGLAKASHRRIAARVTPLAAPAKFVRAVLHGWKGRGRRGHRKSWHGLN